MIGNIWVTLSGCIRTAPKHLPVLVLVTSVVITALVYGRTLEYTFFMDDVLDTTWTEQRSYGEIVTERFPGFGYYRPLPFLIFKASYDLLGEHNTTFLRAILLATHALSAWMLYLLLRRLVRSEWSIVASALFLMFPFSYQNVSVIGAMGHMLVTALLLGSLILWWDGRSRNSLRLLVASVTMAILAVWTMEYGVLGLPLLAGLELRLRWCSHESLLSRPRASYFLVLGAAQIVYFAIWFGTERPDSEPVTMSDVLRNGVFWLQFVAYPFTRFLNVFADAAPGYRMVLMFSVLALLMAVLAHALLKQFKFAVVSLIVAFVCFLPSMLMLTHEYVLSGPRLFYVVSPAVAAFWALLAREMFAGQRFARVWQAAVLVFIVVTILHSHSFIERRLEMFQGANEVVEEIVRVAESSRDTPVLVMNAPAWFSFHSIADQEYPLGYLGVQAVPPHVGFDGLTYAVTGEWADIESGALAPDVSGWDYSWSPHGPLMDHDEVNDRLRSGYELFVMRMTTEGPRLHPAGQIREGDSADDVVAAFGDQLTLLHVDLTVNDGWLQAGMEWWLTEPLEGDFQLSFQIRNHSGEVVLEYQDYALSGMSPLRLWQPGDMVSDRLLLELPDGVMFESLSIALMSTSNESMLKATSGDLDVHDETYIVVTQGLDASDR
jgi:hypothetical protein